MNVIALTAFVGLALVALSIVFFVQQTSTESGSEQDALLPLQDESARPASRNHHP
jgi:hypothetical protein